MRANSSIVDRGSVANTFFSMEIYELHQTSICLGLGYMIYIYIYISWKASRLVGPFLASSGDFGQLEWWPAVCAGVVHHLIPLGFVLTGLVDVFPAFLFSHLLSPAEHSFSLSSTLVLPSTIW